MSVTVTTTQDKGAANTQPPTLTLNANDLHNLRSSFLNLIATESTHISLPIASITELPIKTLRPLRILLGLEQVSAPDDVSGLIVLMNFLILPVQKQLAVIEEKLVGHERHFCTFYRQTTPSDLLSRIVDELFKNARSPYFYFNQKLTVIGFITSLALAPDGTTLFSGSYDGTIIVWRKNTTGSFEFAYRLGGNDANPAQRHTGWVTSLALAPDGTTLFSGSPDKAIIVWKDNLKQYCDRMTEPSTEA